MRVLRPYFFLSFVLILPASSHASLLATLFFKLRSTTASAPSPKPKLPGQETRSFIFRKAHAEDVLLPLRNYVDGVSKASGSVQVRAADNAVVVTDSPENLLRLSALIPEIDQAYENDNVQAREMLATQRLMKAIRNHPDATVLARSAERKAPIDAPANTYKNMPFVIGVHGHDADEMSPLPKSRWINNPTLAQFEVVGWMEDEQGYTIILSNQGQRFLYRHGKLHNGYSPKANLVEGIDGAVHDHQLSLDDGKNHVTLKMLKWHSL